MRYYFIFRSLEKDKNMTITGIGNMELWILSYTDSESISWKNDLQNDLAIPSTIKKKNKYNSIESVLYKPDGNAQECLQQYCLFKAVNWKHAKCPSPGK